MAATRRLAGGGLGIDTRQMHAFASACRKAAPMVSRGLTRTLNASGELVASEARSIAKQHSTSIPPTIKVRRRVATVTVQAGSPTVPLAVLYEEGNKKSRGGSQSQTQFEHPVFGPWSDAPKTWQNRYPFLRPAASKRMPEVDAMVWKGLDGAVEEIAHGR